jgi:hypothetical protein
MLPENVLLSTYQPTYITVNTEDLLHPVRSGRAHNHAGSSLILECECQPLKRNRQSIARSNEKARDEGK